ncbi:MAG TPA: hypothetical protein GX511_03025 [Firmicutes bacterium]|nr:hypothetical protein [Bacillota bacterium]
MTGEAVEGETGRAGQVYARRTGHIVRTGIVQPGIAALQAANAALGYRVEPGVLGELLRQAGLKAAIIGTADTNVRQRPLANLLMDTSGYVPLGEVGPDLLHDDPTGPFGAWTDSEAVVRKVLQVWAQADVVAVEWSDLYRAEEYAATALPAQGAALRRQAQVRLNTFLRAFLPVVTARGIPVLLLSPTPGRADWLAGHRLTPLALISPEVDQGVLTSDTTRRPGLVANIDIAATVAAFFGLDCPPTVLGRPLRTIPAPDPLYLLRKLENRAVLNFTARPLILRIYIVYLIAVLALAVLVAWRPASSKARWLQFLLPAGATVPLTFLILAALPPQTLAATIAWGILITLVLTHGFRRLTTSSSTALMLSAAVTVTLIGWDVVQGQNLVASSLLGYCFISGARYYGLGNEYMGVFLGAALTLAAYLLDRYRPSRLTAGFSLLLLLFSGSFLMADSRLGSNAGGTLAWASGVTAAYLGLYRSELRPRQIILALLLSAAVLAVFVWSDWRLATAASHLGRALDLATRSGGQSLVSTIGRKLAMNLRLVRYSLWSRVLLMLLVVLTSLFTGSYRSRPRFLRQRLLLTTCLRGSLIGSVVAFIANDSGVVAAATSLLFPVAFLILLTLPPSYQENQQNQQELALRRN